MKRVLFAIFAVVVAFTVSAQSEKSIIIEQSSFRPIHSDALTGVNIDPIDVDSSRRPCARIKVRLNRMTREEINEIEVKIVTNNELRKCRTADYENGLIIEMTAKPETRFYFQHPRLGYSNEVLLTLEPNREYRLDAYLNQLLSISIMSDAIGADVYIDEMYKGQIRSNGNLVVHNVSASKHVVRIEHAGKTIAQDIFVNRENIAFGLFTNNQTSSPTIAQQSTQPTEKIYKVGDYYNDGVKEGVVFEVTPDGRHGKIVSMTTSVLQWTSDKVERKRLIGANSRTDGVANMAVVKAIDGWQSKYPAFKWCADLGEGWYLPAIEELKVVYKNRDKLNSKLTDKLSNWYWSSTECNKFCAWLVSMYYGYADGNLGKYSNFYVRAVAKF